MTSILVMARDPLVAGTVRMAVGGGSLVFQAESADEVASWPDTDRFDLGFVFADVDGLEPLAEPGDYRGCLQALREMVPGGRTVVMAPLERIREAVHYVRDGAADYLTYPIAPEKVQHVMGDIERRERLRSELHYLRQHHWSGTIVESLRSRSPAMLMVLHKISQVAPTRSTVLLTGETGTGKSYLARAIHQHSSRASKQLIRVHCGAIPDTLLESELFGHERGAFTGADRRKLGKFEVADGGTLFLDEVATITPAMQVKLLSVLQERVLQRVGGERDIEVDVRILTATNQDLARLCAEGSFRNDLYYRLNVFPIEVPPLRQRREDIPILVESFLERLRLAHGKDIHKVHPQVMKAFLDYAWPGNVRELENLLERAFILESSDTLDPENFPEELFKDRPVGRISLDAGASLATVRRQAVAEAERFYLKEQLGRNGGRIDATAQAAGITTRQLHKLMTRYQLRKEDFKR